MRLNLILLFLGLTFCFVIMEAAIFRRGDKISDKFKQLHLAPEEIDLNVGPYGPTKIQMFDETTDEIFNGNDENEIVDEAQNEIIDESGNEIFESLTTVVPAAANTVAAITVATPIETTTAAKAEQELTGLAKYCSCKGNDCDCCREFTLPFIRIKGPGCARMSYLGNQKMSISLKYGDMTLASRTISGKKARSICVGLPGGYSQFCGRIYGLSRAKENFKACMGFELRADDEVEAALRVSCFKVSPEGLRVAEAEPLPVEANKDEDDDDDDIFGFGAGADDEDEYDYAEDDEEEEEDEDTGDDYADDEAEEDVPSDADYGGFSLAGLLDELDDEEDEDSKPSTTPALTPLKSSTVSLASTRTVVDSVQSKDDTGTPPATAPPLESTETVAPEAAVAAAANTSANQITPAPNSTPNTTAKTKKSKKSKRNQKQKAGYLEGDFAYEVITGLLDFFAEP